MKHADRWVLKELNDLNFAGYAELLPKVKAHMQDLYSIESRFAERTGNRLTKKQAVCMGLLARTFQLSIACLVNQLLQNYAGWIASFRTLLETFFVLDWIKSDIQRAEAYFEKSTPAIGKIKAEVILRFPNLNSFYKQSSSILHINSKSLHLSRKEEISTENELVFTATNMFVGGEELKQMLLQFELILDLSVRDLKIMLLENFDATSTGEALWSGRRTTEKFGCLHWAKSK